MVVRLFINMVMRREFGTSHSGIVTTMDHFPQNHRQRMIFQSLITCRAAPPLSDVLSHPIRAERPCQSPLQRFKTSEFRRHAATFDLHDLHSFRPFVYIYTKPVNLARFHSRGRAEQGRQSPLCCEAIWGDPEVWWERTGEIHPGRWSAPALPSKRQQATS